MTPFSDRRFWLFFIAGTFTWMLLHALVLIGMGFSTEIAVTDSFVSNILLALACLMMINTLRFYLPKSNRYLYLLIWSFVETVLWMLISRGILLMIYREDPLYHEFLNQSVPVRFGIALLLIGCMVLLSVLWYTVHERRAENQRKSDVEKLAREAELFSLRQQLQPHFLFNSLNSINALIGSRPEEARRMIQQLSDFLRGTLKKEDQQLASFKEELHYLQLYLDIEKVRFGHRLSTVIDHDEASEQMKLPSLLLQPIVENAIKFGLYDTTGDVTIQIHAGIENNQLVVTVSNPFDPETSQPQTGTGFGLNSVKRRLYLLFARNDLLETKAEDNHFTTIVKIPQSL